VSYTVLVTGATGKTGRRVAHLLAERGVAVRAASRTPLSAHLGVEPARFDWSDESTHESALKGADAVYIVATHVAGNEDDLLGQIERFVARAAEFGVGRTVLLSGYGVENLDPSNSMRRVEVIVEGAATPATILRPCSFMQNFSESHWWGTARKIRQSSELAMPVGEYPMAHVSTGDIAAVAAIALTESGHEDKSYTLTGPESLTLIQVADIISAATGRQVRYVDPGRDAIRDGLLSEGAPPDVAEHMTSMYVWAATSGAMAAITDDYSTVTGRPPTSFASFAHSTAGAWMR
jgi:uncharacterized protein YbjT (DUF2867 family)